VRVQLVDEVKKQMPEDPFERLANIPSPLLTMEDKFALIEALRGVCKGGPSMADELIAERRSDKW
jgi:hypothetical protein